MPFQTTIEDDVIREYSSARAIVERILDKIPRAFAHTTDTNVNVLKRKR